MPVRYVRLPLLALGVALGACASSPTSSGTPADAGTDIAPSVDVGTTPPADTGTTPPADTGAAPPADAGADAPITGTLGTLGAVQPIVSSLVISNSGETLVYLSTAPLSCATLQSSRWLGTQPAGSQVIEVVMRGAPTAAQMVQVPPGEVNYAAGGRSSSYEVGASADTITFTEAAAGGPVAGTLRATYRNGSMIAGSFRAEFCDHGQQY